MHHPLSFLAAHAGSATLVLLCLVSVIRAASHHPPPGDPLVRHEWHEARHVEGWQRRGRLAANATLPMRIGFAQPGAAQAHDVLMAISHPDSSRYGKHLTSDEVVDLFAPAAEAVDQVWAWVVGAGIAPDRLSMSVNKQWLQFEARVDEAERLLQARYYSYEHSASGVHLTACPEYHVPARLREHVDYVVPGTKLASYGFAERVRARARINKRQENKGNQGTNSTSTGDKKKTKKTKKTKLPLRKNANNSTAGRSGAAPAPPWAIGGCDRYATFACIQEQYGLPNATTAAPGNELGIFQSLGMHYSQEDLDIYFSYTAPQIPTGTSPELRAVDGAFGPALEGGNKTATGLEANLDFQMAMPLIYPQNTVLWQVDDEWYENDMLDGDTEYPGFFNTFFDALDGSYCTASAFGQTGNCQDPACRDPVYPDPHGNDPGAAPGAAYQGPLMCGAFSPTNVLAISYSGVEQGLPAAYLQRQCLEVLKLGLRGVTVVQSAGDNGVGGAGGRSSNPYVGCLGANRTVFSPRTLSDCPYVLSVGGTVLVRAPGTPGTPPRGVSPGSPPRPQVARRFAETAPTYYSSGGGFSNVFPTPGWQQAAVDGYLAGANLSFRGYEGNLSRPGSPPGLFNRRGRGYPDVAAVGDNVMIVYQGYAVRVAGTSISAPIWAAVLTLVNEARLLANKSAVGFVQPALYQHPEVFTDITAGSNPGCGSRGFPATRGWDPVTGLGTPIFPKLRDLFMSLP